MRYGILLGFAGVLALCGCFAIVDQDNKVRAYGTTRDEVLDTLERAQEASQHPDREFILFEKSEPRQ